MTQKRNFRKITQQLGKRTMLAIIAMLIVGAVNAQKPKLAVMDFMAGVGLYQNDVKDKFQKMGNMTHRQLE